MEMATSTTVIPIIQWDASEKSQWNQRSYPGYPDINPELALPSDAYERIDFVYNPTPRVVVEQTQPLSPDPGCDSTRLQGLPTSLGDIFIGQASVELEYDGVDYASPSAFYLEAYRLGAEDVQPDAYDGTPPFPFGLPVMNSGAQYCANIQAKMHFATAYDGYAFSDESEVFGTDYQVAIQNTLSYPQDFTSVQLEQQGGVDYGFQAAAPP